MKKYVYRCDVPGCNTNAVQDEDRLPPEWVILQFDVIQSNVKRRTLHLCPTHREAMNIETEGDATQSLGDELITVLKKVYTSE